MEQTDIDRLKQKANACGFNGRGCLSYYISKIANEPIVFLNNEIINLMKAERQYKGGLENGRKRN